ncbi:MAG: family metallopeptidase [Bacteroidetes bacterium]|nr:family metallopeptidase [Bacteroidota bacterium]
MAEQLISIVLHLRKHSSFYEMVLALIILSGLIFFNVPGEEPKDRSLFVSPVKIPLSLSANFGELRIDHFHSGLDIKTQGVTGKEVIAAASGYVYRISISPGGFGKALYLRHPSGYSTVYGHLDKFSPEIEEYVVSRQYEDKSFMITLWPPKDRFRFNQGDLIAYSGNSGSSSGPHLHYEIRESDEEVPVNPLLFDFGIEDDLKPVIEKLVIYPAREKTLINRHNKLLKINITGSNGNYYIPSKNEVSISGPAGFGLKAYDLLNNSYNKFSVFSIELRIDSISVYNYKMNAFAFNESRYVNSHIDYETFLKENTYIERAFLLPNDKLSVYQNVINKGIFSFSDGKKHFIEIIVADINNNKSTLSFYANSTPAPWLESEPEKNEKSTVLMPYNRNNKFVSKDVAVNIPAGTLYDTLHFEFMRSDGNAGMYSDIFQIHNKYTPVHKTYTLSIKPDRVPQGKGTKLIIVQLDNNITKSPVPSIWDNGYLTANPSTFGSFYVGIDTIPPLISPNGFSSGGNLSDKTGLRIKIRDDFSGIKSYEPSVDGKWALFEYDQKNDLLIYKFDSRRIQKGSAHNLTLKVIDNRDNVSTYNCEFTW